MTDPEYIHVDDLGTEWRVDVCRAWRGLDMKSTFAAQLMTRSDGMRWRKLGKSVLSDDGPIAAISDLLSVLDMGRLPR